MNDPRGSIWRKWDLHLHTPASYDYEDKAVKAGAIIAKLKEEDIGAVAITDHNLIDVKIVGELKSLAGDEITVFPGIELRSELGGSEWVHFTGIFPEDCDLEDVWTKIQGQLSLTPADRERIGEDAIYVPIRKAANLFHSFGGLVLVHAGKKSNSIENIANDEKHKMKLKKDLAVSSIDILEVGALKDITSYREKVFPDIEMELPLIICSDNHDIGDYEFEIPCWIKADTTIAGLKQVIEEPNDRIYVGKIPYKLDHVAVNPTKFIKSINIHKIEGSDLKDIWFDNKVILNYGLVAIIGNKGGGKSALADTIGLLGNSKNEEHFSFLHEEKFRNPKENLSKHFTANLVWASNSETSKILSDHVNPDVPETVKYIPQKFLDKVCTQIAEGEGSLFERELDEAVFSHVDEAERLEKRTLDDLLSYKTEEIRNKIDTVIGGIKEDNAVIVKWEVYTTPEHRNNIEERLRLKTEELQAHEGIKPAEVRKPEVGSGEEQIETDIETITKGIKTIDAQIAEAREQVSSLNSRISKLDKSIEAFDTFQYEYKRLEEKLSEELKKLGIKFEDVVTFTLNTTPLTVLKNSLMAKKEKAEPLLDEDDPGNLFGKKSEEEKKNERLRERLNKPLREYEEYSEASKKWDERRQAIEGSETKPDTLRYYKVQLEEITEVPERLASLYSSRLNKAEEVYSEIKRLADVYEGLYAPVQKFIKTQNLISEELDLQLDVSIQESGFESGFFDYINQARTGSFYGAEEGRAVSTGILARYDFNSWDNVKAFIEEILEHLREDKREVGAAVRKEFIGRQMKRDKNVADFYDFIFSLNYLEPKFVFKMGNKEMQLVSPGERGALLLIFYMLIEMNDVPLIIDQPEDNLDNQTIYSLLVPCIREAKKKRQIFLVTHNPNLAVVCDAEQVIRASHYKEEKNCVTYVSGGIESPEINKAVLDVLEGTKPAFDNRRFKYQTVSE